MAAVAVGAGAEAAAGAAVVRVPGAFEGVHAVVLLASGVEAAVALVGRLVLQPARPRR